MTREDLVPLIGKRVDVSHGAGVDGGLLVLDVGEHSLFGRRPAGVPDPIIPLAEISRVSWTESTRRSIPEGS